MSLILAPSVFAASGAGKPVILVLGDSLSAGYGLDAGDGWVALLEQKLKSQALSFDVVNASISGETTAGGLVRLPALLERHQPKWVLVELGGNDGLRALPVKQMRSNLERMVDLSAKAGATAVLFEMRIPANYGAAYTQQFTRTFTDVAQAKNVPLVPFLLAPIATDPRAFQDDGIHPSAAAQPRILETIWPALKSLLIMNEPGPQRAASTPRSAP